MFTLPADQLPGGRGHGEPVRLMVDLEENHDFVEIFVHEPGRKLLVAATSGHGFIVPEDEVVAMTRKGKQVHECRRAGGGLRLRAGRGRHGRHHRREPQDADLPADEVPEMARGKGVRLQRFKDGGLSDVRVFKKADGLSWLDPPAHLHAAVRRAARTGSASAPRPDAWRPGASRNPTSSGRHSEPPFLIGLCCAPALAPRSHPRHG